jgi:hypothetical protein
LLFQFGQLLFIGFPAGQMRIPSSLKVNSPAVKYVRALEVGDIGVDLAIDKGEARFHRLDDLLYMGRLMAQDAWASNERSE